MLRVAICPFSSVFLCSSLCLCSFVQPEILSERFQRQETITLGEALFLIDQVGLDYVRPPVSRQRRVVLRFHPGMTIVGYLR